MAGRNFFPSRISGHELDAPSFRPRFAAQNLVHADAPNTYCCLWILGSWQIYLPEFVASSSFAHGSDLSVTRVHFVVAPVPY
jgi:hypothetical protein